MKQLKKLLNDWAHVPKRYRGLPGNTVMLLTTMESVGVITTKKKRA